MLHTAVRALTRATFGSAIEGKTDVLIAAINDINAYINPVSLSNLLRLPNSVRRWVTPGFTSYSRAIATVRQIFGDIIRERLESGRQQPDLLGMIMTGKDDETAETMTEAQLHDEMMTILMAGHETTGIATAWSWYWMSRHPEVERRLHEEVEAVLGGRSPGFDDVPKLEYARQIFQEAMRLTPPIWAYDRRASEADAIGGFDIPRGTIVAMSPYLMHRHPRYWERPDVFDPDRFVPAEIAKRPQYAYFPFGGGPRRCIGFKFALMEGQLILATLAQSFTARLTPGQVVEPAPRLNFPPKSGLRMTIAARQPRAPAAVGA
jgi:cytochrome P450